MTGFNGGTQPIIFTHCEVRKNEDETQSNAQGDHLTWKENGAGLSKLSQKPMTI